MREDKSAQEIEMEECGLRQKALHLVCVYVCVYVEGSGGGACSERHRCEGWETVNETELGSE